MPATNSPSRSRRSRLPRAPRPRHASSASLPASRPRTISGSWPIATVATWSWSRLRTAPGGAIRSPQASSIIWWKCSRIAGESTDGRYCRSGPSDAGEPVEAAIFPIAARVGVGHFDGGDPFRILEAELGRRAQAQRKAERIGDRLPRIFRCQDGLRMERRRHVDAAAVIVGASEGDILRLEVRADPLQEVPQIHAGPLPDIVPALDADMPDDPFLLRQPVELLHGPRLLVGDPAGELQLPCRAIDPVDVLDAIIGVETRRLHDLGFAVGRRQVARPEHQRLDAIVEGGHRAKHRLHRVLVGYVAAGQHGKRAKAERAAQEFATVDLGEKRLVVRENALIDCRLGPELRR